MRVALHHSTRYSYERPAAMSPQLVRLRPASHTRTRIHSYSLRIEPKDHFLNWAQDPHGNFVARVVVPDKTKVFSVTVDLVADLVAFNPFDFFLDPTAEKFPFEYDRGTREELEPYLVRGELTPRLSRFIETLDKRRRGTVDFLVDANRAVQRAVHYVVRMEPGVQTPEETLIAGRGSCRDSGWLLVQILRHLGLAARFVSGYLIQLKPDVRPTEGPPGPERDFTDLHAWCECYVPGAGWIGLDPTSGLFAAEGHIPLAGTPSPGSAAPVDGAVEKVETAFAFSMSVERLDEVPRPAKPFSDDEWERVLEAGARIDAELVAGDVRLTMGGEPTFVSADAPDAPEWNVEALGGRKEALGDALLRRLHRRWQPGSLIHHGQGKWYPGEQLPRWAITCFYRADGVPLWNDPNLIAESGRDYGHEAHHAERFARKVVDILGLADHGLRPAFEDVWYYLWRERRLPANVDPLDAKLDDPVERERLARVFRQGLGSVVGWLLPLSWSGGWRSGKWFLREDHLFLLPGDSPMGFRLPLDSLPWLTPGERPVSEAPDPFAERGPLPVRFQTARKPANEGSGSGEPVFDARSDLVRTALCVEPRGGCLRVFTPPLESLEAYCDLIAAIEDAAAALGIPVQIEGYPPPRDPRLQKFSATPDPGVLEVNVPPVRTFDELVRQTEELYQSARLERLVPDKFEIDGLHIGSGGGHQFTLGGPTAAESPFLRRPDLVGSLASYLNNHPSLSYLFAGRFIGPTSQAPRADEARHESVYELELGVGQLPARDAGSPPWLVDRVMRNLLVDVTGNTHRAEMCIDKLFSPDGPSGRQGLVELRSFEMAPHPRMGIVNGLLLRALVAAFWKEPYRERLVRWGTSLHDRFMLPHFLWQDFCDVLADLGRRGHPLRESWFEPHRDFRFPIYGVAAGDSIALEVRAALEPWPVLGEEGLSSGQARFVDSSLERLQVRVCGLTDSRHRILCNGVELPLHPTGTRGEAVAGVRFRAWQPPSCLHPRIGVHGPLRFDVYDDWAGRSLFGATYYVSHPGGRANLDRPVNAAAAESRRLSRFETMGHTPGSFRPARAPKNPDYPMTLDLRLLGNLRS